MATKSTAEQIQDVIDILDGTSQLERDLVTFWTNYAFKPTYIRADNSDMAAFLFKKYERVKSKRRDSNAGRKALYKRR